MSGGGFSKFVFVEYLGEDRGERKWENAGIYVAEKNPQEYRRISQENYYPKAIYFIITTEFFERFTYYGIRHIIAQFLGDHLHMSPYAVRVFNQVFLMFSYCFPVMGAVLADCWLNKFRTVLYMIPVYALGAYIVVLSTLPKLSGMALAMTGLVITYIGLGGVRPCVVSIGGDQFILPRQESYLKKYFSVFYFTINASSFLADILIPALSERDCFGKEVCYFAAFLSLAVSISIAEITFFSGKKFYYIRNPECNIVAKMFKCIFYALKKREKTKGHWLDKAADKFDPAFINDIKTVLRILVLYIPLPFFRALYDQHGARWQFQASRMSGDIGKLKLEAEQMGAANSILVLLFIPLFEAFLYPTFAKYNMLKRPLQRLTVGGLLAALAFLLSALVEMQLEPTDDYLPKPNQGQVRFFNAMPEPLSIEFINPQFTPEVIPSLGEWNKLNIPMKGDSKLEVKYPVNGTETTRKFDVHENALTSYLFTTQNVIKIESEDGEKSKEGDPKVMVIYVQPAPEIEIVSVHCDNTGRFTITHDEPYTPYEEVVDCDSYHVEHDGDIIFKNVEMKQGGVYVAMLLDLGDGKGIRSNLLTVVEPNTIHMLWLMPQYVLITAGEVMFSITGFEFSFTQAPVSMKCLVQSAWLLTAAFGKVIVLSAGSEKLFNRMFSEFLLFAALMTFDMLIFATLAVRYKYVKTKDDEAGTSYR